MATRQRLRGRRIAVLAADGFERVELVVPVRAMQLAGAEVDIISLRHGRIRGVNLHEPASRIHVDRTLDEASPDDYDALMIPGGFINPDLLRQSADARAFVRAFDSAGKPIATLCHGPWVLASAGLLEGRIMTSWPGIRDDLVHAGATWLDQEVVRDHNLLTSRGPQDMKAFVRELIEHVAAPSEQRAAEVAIQHVPSSPQRDHPPGMVVSALRWIPRPSLRTAVAVLAAVLGFGAWQARRTT